MADKGTPGDGPSLEMPSLSLRRRNRRGASDADAVEAAPDPAAEAPAAAATPGPAPEPGPAPHTEPAPPSAAPRRRPSLPALTGLTAALATGAVVGALTVLLVWAASMGCEAVRGTASCGGGPGFWVLVAILAVVAYAGGALLRAFGVSDGGSTSLLAVGVMAVLVLVLFTDALFEPWMALAVPVVTALSFALAWWVSSQVVHTDDDRSPSRR